MAGGLLMSMKETKQQKISVGQETLMQIVMWTFVQQLGVGALGLGWYPALQ